MLQLFELLVFALCVFKYAASTTDFRNDLLDAWASEPECAREDLGAESTCGIGAIFLDVAYEDGSLVTHVQKLYRSGGGNVNSELLDRWEENGGPLHEIASNSKVFTAALMQAMVDDNSIRYSTNIGQVIRDVCRSKYKVHLKSPVTEITVFELASHISGLPAQAWNRHVDEAEDSAMGGSTPEAPLMGVNKHGAEGFNPFYGYTEEDMCRFLEWPLDAQPGQRRQFTTLPSKGRFLYSNIAFGILGYMLQLVAKKLDPDATFATLVDKYVFEPLEMFSTKVLTPESEEWAKVEHGSDVRIVKQKQIWRKQPYGVLQGNGAFHSTLADMSKLLEATIKATLGASDKPIYQSLRKLLVPIQWDIPCVRENCEQKGWAEGPSISRTKATLGWNTFSSGLEVGYCKGGDTEGYSSFMAFLTSNVANGGRAVYAFDTCAGCGSGTAGGLAGEQGSATQRVVQIGLGGEVIDPALFTPTRYTIHEDLSLFEGTYAADRMQGDQDEHGWDMSPKRTMAPRQTLKVTRIFGTTFEIEMTGIGGSKKIAAQASLSYDSRFVDSHPVRLCVTEGFLGSAGGGISDETPLAKLPQRREFFFLQGGGGAIPPITSVVFLDGGKDSFFYPVSIISGSSGGDYFGASAIGVFVLLSALALLVGMRYAWKQRAERNARFLDEGAIELQPPLSASA